MQSLLLFTNKYFIPLIIVCFPVMFANSQKNDRLWHGIERTLRYHPEGTDIVITNGGKRFNRALYGGNTAFRAEAGDLPEFALYMPGMGGNLQFGIIAGDSSKWLIHAAQIKAIYRAGSMLYEIKDPLLQKGVIKLHAIALYDSEALIVKLSGENIPVGVQLVAVYGGATGKKFSRDGDIGADPESSFYLKPAYCNDNIYAVDKHRFIVSYGFTAALSEEERYEIQHQGVNDTVAKTDQGKQIAGVFPLDMAIHIADANALQSPVSVIKSSKSKQPVATGKLSLAGNKTFHFYIGKKGDKTVQYDLLSGMFDRANAARKELAERVKIETPDPFINALGPVLGVAADAVWESPSYMHGAVAWRMRLNGWRGAYIADVLGWHNRAKEHFNGYALSQLTTPPVKGVVMDTALHLARHLEKIGTALFSEGYISRNPNDSTKAHHYDMNLVFIDQLFNHFNWNGDTAYVKKMWPLIKRHLAWEKRNFDKDGDGLYDSYAAIWASDALQYSGGGATHSSAYNYRANEMAAMLAKLLGEDPAPYKAEAEKILQAVNDNLWIKDKGWYAEYKDLLGNQLVHASPGMWTIYHAIDEGISNRFQSWQTLNFIDHQLPHISIKAKGLPDSSLYTIPTTTWQPYTWSLNNVALAELLHTSLAYWQAGRNNDAYRLWKSSLVESMFLSSSPGNIQQLSFYDAIRGELYRDFADPIGMAGRSLVEGLFGVQPNALHDSLLIAPGFPDAWEFARLHTPDIRFDFKRSGNTDEYNIVPAFRKKLYTVLHLPVRKDALGFVLVNGKPVAYHLIRDAVGRPLMKLDLPYVAAYKISVNWNGENISDDPLTYDVKQGQSFKIGKDDMQVTALYDPQGVLSNPENLKEDVVVSGDVAGVRTFFVKRKQGIAEWWQPINIDISEPKIDKGVANENGKAPVFQPVDLSKDFNEKVTNIFKQEYLSPRPQGPTLQLPTQGIGNWAYPFIMPEINDSGMRKAASRNNQLTTPKGVLFATPADTTLPNIVFVSQWDNFPVKYSIPLSGKADALYLLMTGTTNPMQSRITNGRVIAAYTDNAADTLELINPENWWPIEQDYYVDGFAFTAGEEKPERLFLETGRFGEKPQAYYTIKGFSNMGVPGGAANVLHMPLNKEKVLNSLTVEAVANDVIIGLMAATLER